MELQKLIDGLKAHKNGAASYESVDEAIRVFEAMRDVDGEKVVKGLETIADNMPKIISWEYGDLLQNTVGTIECAIALIRQQQERIKELEAAGQVPVKYPTCGCCGKEIDHINTSVFNYDGSDSDVSIPVLQEPSGGCVSFDTNRNWTDYELTDEERKEGIRCPYCGKYPFDRETEIELFEPVCVMMWPVRKSLEVSHDI